MDLMLTSYGLSHLTAADEGAAERVSFRGRPPLSMSQFARMLLPEYSVLLLCRHVVLDRQTYEQILDEHDWTYYQYAETFKALKAEGFVRLEDFRGVVESKKELLQEMLTKDLANIEQWIPPLKESESIWRSFLENCLGRHRDAIWDGMRSDKLTYVLFRELKDAMNDDQRVLTQALRYSSKRRKAKYRNAVKRELTKYLSQINANLVLSHILGCGISDWQDHAPFYREKWLSIGRESTPDEDRATEVKKLFEVSFPELAFRGPSTVIRILKDKRLIDLRDLVDRARKGEVTFDREFARRTLNEVLSTERRVARIRKFVSYATMPIGFVPVVGTPLQKIIEEAVGASAEELIKRELNWYYLLSELVDTRERSSPRV